MFPYFTHSKLYLTKAKENHGDDEQLEQLNEDRFVTPDEMDRIVANEMSKLDVQERDKVLHELHGLIDTKVEVSSDFLMSKLNLLSFELDKNVSENRATSFCLAVQQNKSFVYDRKRLRRFLFAENFNIKAATQRILLYYEKKEELFGPSKLGKDILQSDLSDQDMEALSSGFIQKLPVLDRGGRVVAVCCPALKRNIEAIHLARAVWYMANPPTAAEEEAAAACGSVTVVYDVGRENVDIRDVSVPKIGNLMRCIPMKNVGFHLCYDKPHMKVLASLIMLFLGKERRLRTRLHYGTAMECQYKLMTFGIPRYALPFNDDGTYCLENHMNYLVSRRILEMEFDDKLQPIAEKSIHINEDKDVDDQFDLLLTEDEPLDLDQVLPIDSINDFELLSTLLNSDAGANDRSYNDSDNSNSINNFMGIGIDNQVAEKIAHVTVENDDNQQQERKNEVATEKIDANIIMTPNRYDVLFGKGRVISNHSGNVRFLHLIESYAEQYELASKFAKTDIACEIMKAITDDGGRFLKRNDEGGWWEPVSAQLARNKVSHAFRSRRAVVSGKKKEHQEQRKVNKKKQLSSQDSANSSIDCLATDVPPSTALNKQQSGGRKQARRS